MALGSAPLSARQLPAALAPMAGPVDQATTYSTTTTQYAPPGRPAIELVVVSKAEASDRAAGLADAGTRTLALLDDWLGPLVVDRVTIVDVAWNSGLAGAAVPGVVAVRSRWLSQVRDRALEREVVAGLSRQYWPRAADGPSEGIATYIAGRAIDTLLEGSQYHADRYLGGFLPFAIRSVALSPLALDSRPRLRRYPELERAAPQAQREARALEVAERYLGWPALQQALSTLRARMPIPSAAGLAAVISEQQGRDLSWLFEAVLPADATFDYAVGSVENRPGQGHQFDVRVTIDRRGSAVFARPLPIELRFANGTVMHDRWDPQPPQVVLDYVSTSPLVSAAIDPEVILILDQQRSNNMVQLQPAPWRRLALRLACDWTIWLQQAMLAYSGLV
jgi:hypothetical protein